MYLILKGPTHCSANHSKCYKWLNDTKYLFSHGFIVPNKLFGKTSHYDHYYSIFITILNILHVPKITATLSVWGKCSSKKPSHVFSNITTTKFCWTLYCQLTYWIMLLSKGPPCAHWVITLTKIVHPVSKPVQLQCIYSTLKMPMTGWAFFACMCINCS